MKMKALSKCVNKYWSAQGISCGRQRERARRLTTAHQEAICDWVDEDCSLTLKQLADEVKRLFGILVSVSTVRRALKGFHYSFKCVTRVPD